jgi:hypothetical protein
MRAAEARIASSADFSSAARRSSGTIAGDT